MAQDGYVMLHPDLPPDVSPPGETPTSYNAMICDKVNKLQALGRDTGNNLLPQLPELMTLFDHPIIHGALQSILGDDYYIHLHHATHTKRGIEEGLGQRHHKDSVGIHYPFVANSRSLVQDLVLKLVDTHLGSH